MASAIGAALISTILEPMAAKAMDNGKRIVKYIAEKAVDKAVDKVMDKPMDKVMAMVHDKVDGIVNIEGDISKLQTTLYMIQDIVQVAEEKQIDKQGKPRVFIQNWLRDLVDIAYEARDVLDDFNTFSSCIITAGEASNPVDFISSLVLSYFGGLSSDTSNIPLTVLNRLEKDIRSVTERFDVKIKESEKFNTLRSVVGGGGSESVKPRTPVGPFINKQRDGLLLGRKNAQEEIMDKILHPSDDRVDVVVIWGMGGIGKTTLARSIYNDKRVNKVSRKWSGGGEKEFCAKKVIMKIIGDLSIDDEESLQEKLVEKFEGNRFLIVLDDVWDVKEEEWNLLFDPLTNVENGGMIIITRRERQLCDEITSQTAYNLRPLSEEDSWSIFESCAYVNGKSDSTPYLKRIGKKIVKKLNGHPLALKVVGRSLLHKDSSSWKKFLESKFPKDDEVASALRWSYNHLPRHLKTCFTYCALFPKDHVLDKKVLVQIWMAHDLIQKEEQERPEDVGAQYFEELVNASLLQCVDGKHVMHDLIYDFALLVSNGEFANSSLTNDQMETVRHVTITPDDYSKIQRLCKMEKLLTLYITDEICTRLCKIEDFALDDVFKQLKSIRVLVLCGKGIKEIPDGISELKHLRYLDVSETSVKSLPDSLCDLYHLQTLAAPLDAVLPRNIVNMVNLRYVRASLSTCKGVGKLTSLQELSSIHVCEGDNIRELGDMQRLHGELRIEGLENVSTLEGDAGALMKNQTLMDELELEFNQDSAKSTISAQVLDALGCPPYLTYLGISSYNGLKPPSWMVDGKHKFDKLQTLELYDCPKLESLPPLGGLTSLKHLSLVNVGVKRLGEEFYGNLTKKKVFFPSLESLSFSKMNEWEEWDDIIIENSTVSFFPLLTRLEIHRCPKLQIVLPVIKEGEDNKHPIMNAANFMKSLSRLEKRKCNGLKQLQLDALVSLKELNISNCSSLVQITSAECLANTIESLQIYKCSHLETMGFKRLPSLKVLNIKRCDNLISIPCLDGIMFLNLYKCGGLRSLSNNIQVLNSLIILKIMDCPLAELESSSSSSGNSVAVPIRVICTNNTQIFRTLIHHELTSLEYLQIENLTGFENFGKTEANNFCKLKSFFISECKDLKSLPTEFHKLSSLERLYIDGFPQLQSLPTEFHKLSSLNSLFIKSCRQLQSLPLDFNKLSSLKNLCINDCRQLQSLPPDFCKLSSLERLSINDCPELQSLPRDFCKLSSSLKYLYIEGCRQLQSMPPGFGELSSLKMLDIISCPQLQSLPQDFCKLSSLKYLYIEGCRQLQSVPPSFGELSSLKMLDIISCSQLQSLPPDFHNLSSLERLSINDCPELQSLPPDFHKLSSLERLSITHCRQLQSLPPGFGELSSLKMLDIISCPQLQSLPQDFCKLSSLKKLRIICCQELQSLPPSFGELSSLKKLKIISCPRLQSLPADDFPPSLRRLTIENCELLYERCKDESGLDWHKINNIRWKKILISLCNRCKDKFGFGWGKIKHVRKKTIFGDLEIHLMMRIDHIWGSYMVLGTIFGDHNFDSVGGDDDGGGEYDSAYIL